jgi:eukaryotic-like serine/threonine-protein kinase
MLSRMGSSPSACLTEDDLLGFVHGRLAPDVEQRVQDHIDRCPDCRVLASETANLVYGEGTSPPVNLATPTGPTAFISLSSRSTFVAPGEHIGRYIVNARLGEGGMGVVYAARDPSLDRNVALKLLHADLASDGRSAAGRLMREAQAMARLSHPNVVTVHDIGTYENRLFMAMEMIEGQTLRQWLAERTRSWTEIVGVFQHAGNGLVAAHRVQLVHRDFKPENVLVGADGRVCVTDFGLARSVAQIATPEPGSPTHSAQSPAGLMFTKTGHQIGTPAYMAPEQFSGTATDARTDQFSFCVALYEALYGHRPFEGYNVETLSQNVLAGVTRTPAESRVPQAIHAAVLRGLSVAPADRFRSMDELLAELTPDVKPSRPRRRVALLWTGIAGCAALVGALTAWRLSSSDSGSATSSPPVTSPATAVAVDPASASPPPPDPAAPPSPPAGSAAASPAPGAKPTKPVPKVSASHHHALPDRKSSHGGSAATTAALPSRTDLETPPFAKATLP